MKDSKSRLIVEEKWSVGDHRYEMIAWDVPESDHYPHGISFRFWFGRQGRTLVLYDIHHGKSYHKHFEGRELVYEFRDLDTLIKDFLEDTEKFR